MEAPRLPRSRLPFKAETARNGPWRVRTARASAEWLRIEIELPSAQDRGERRFVTVLQHVCNLHAARKLCQAGNRLTYLPGPAKSRLPAMKQLRVAPSPDFSSAANRHTYIEQDWNSGPA